MRNASRSVYPRGDDVATISKERRLVSVKCPMPAFRRPCKASLSECRGHKRGNAPGTTLATLQAASATAELPEGTVCNNRTLKRGAITDKLGWLQNQYVWLRTNTSGGDPAYNADSRGKTLMNMPNDGICPSALAYALKTAQMKPSDGNYEPEVEPGDLAVGQS
jgi:hypothetical protein